MRLLVTLSTPAEGLFQLTLQFRKPRLCFDSTLTSYISSSKTTGLQLDSCGPAGATLVPESPQYAPAPSHAHSDTFTFSFNHALFPPLTCTQSDTFTFGYIPNSWHSHSVMSRVLHPHLITITPSHSPFSYTTNAAHLPPHSIIITCD